MSKLEAVGIITEYNPFHNGHLHQLNVIKEKAPTACIVVVMSGNFLQRGEPACLDKWTRAKEALVNGVDLIIELPPQACIQPADRFAFNGVNGLASLGVDYLVFGAEHAEYDFMNYASQVQGLKGEFKKYNQSYAASIQAAITQALGHELAEPNDLLALAYAKANLKLGSPLKLQPIQRIQAGYHELALKAGQQIASASAIRSNYQQGRLAELRTYVPHETYADLSANSLVFWDDFWPFLRYKLLTTTPKELANIYGMAEGIEYRLVQKANELAYGSSFDDWLHAVKTKRFTYTRLARLAVAMLLNLQTEDVTSYNEAPYFRLLGFTKRGQEYLNAKKKQFTFPLITKVTQKDAKGSLAVDYRVGKLYQSLTGKEQDLKKAPLRIF